MTFKCSPTRRPEPISKGYTGARCNWPIFKAWFTIYARDGCEAARLRANSSEKVLLKCLQSMRVCLQNFPVCVTSQLVAQTTKESDHSFTVEFTAHKCTSTEENKMALACEKRRSHWFFVFRPLLCLCFFSFLFFFFSHFFADSYCRENH